MDAMVVALRRGTAATTRRTRGKSPGQAGQGPAVPGHVTSSKRIALAQAGKTSAMEWVTGTQQLTGPNYLAMFGAQRLPLAGSFSSDTLPAGRDDSRPVAEHELHGEPDGPPARLASGVLVYKRRIGDRRVSSAEYLQACRGIAALPPAHQQAIANAGVPVYLVPSAGLEDGLLGATTIVQDTDGSPWRPTLVRVAVSAGRPGVESTAEIAQHELGHVLAVLTGQDRSEQAAERYAQQY